MIIGFFSWVSEWYIYFLLSLFDYSKKNSLRPLWSYPSYFLAPDGGGCWLTDYRIFHRCSGNGWKNRNYWFLMSWFGVDCIFFHIILNWFSWILCFILLLDFTEEPQSISSCDLYRFSWGTSTTVIFLVRFLNRDHC